MTNPILESGTIKKCELCFESEEKYEIIFLNENNLKDILRLQEDILLNLQDPELYAPASADLLSERLSKEQFVIGVLTEKRLIAFGIIHIPGDAEDNLGRDIGMPEAMLNNVAHLQFIVVHPHYRGNSFQKKLAKNLLNVIEDMGYEHVLGTISPKNYFSLRNMLELDFVVKEIKIKYGGMLRCIIYRNIAKANPSWKEVAKIKSSDINGQKMLIKRGFVGFAISDVAENFMIHYGKAN